MKMLCMSWNARSIRKNNLNNKLIELRSHILSLSNPYHLIFIQETWLDEKCKIELPGYFCLRKDHLSDKNYPHGGVLIFIHKSIVFREINFCTSEFSDSVFAQISSGSFDFVIGSVYASPSTKISERKQDFHKLVTRPGPFVLAGDFNSKHISWNNEKSDRSGMNLQKLCDNNLCEIHFSDEPTTYPSVGSPSFLDLVISKGLFGISKPKAIDDPSSDHRPIVFEIPVIISPESPLLIRNFKEANWRKFRQSIISQLDSSQHSPGLIESTNAVDEAVDSFLNMISVAMETSIPRKKPFLFRHKFSQKIKNMISDRNFLRKQSARYPILKAEVNDLNRKIRLEQSIEINQSWSKKCKSLDLDDGSFYCMAKALKRKKLSTPTLKSTDDRLLYSDKEKAEAFAAAFKKSHHLDPSPTTQSDSVKLSSEIISDSESNFQSFDKISKDDILVLISRLKTKKSPGYDNIPCLAIKNLPIEAVSFLCRLYNSCFKLGYFPSSWKIGKVIAVAKPGKDKSLPSSYRPITLLPIIGKLFEKFILERLLEHDSENNILIPQQFGFRSKHSTTQQILRITETVSLRFNKDKSTAMTLLDIEKAFDSVWHNALLSCYHSNFLCIL